VIRRFWLGLLWLVLAVPLPALARDAAASALVVRVDAGSSGVDPAEVRAAIARELGETKTAGSVDVRIGKSSITVVYTDPSGQKLRRVIDRPKDPGQEVDTIALLAGNLARDEARELASKLGPKAADQPPATEPPATELPATEPPATEPPAAEPPAATEPPVTRPPGAPRTREAPPAAARLEPTPPSGGPRTFLSLSLFHPIAFPSDGHERTVELELGLAYSRLGGLAGAAIGIGAVRTHGLAQGLIVSGIWTWSEDATDGAAISGVFATAAGRLRGVEASGVLNWRQGDAHGVQASGVFNRANDVQGAQIAVGNSGAEVRGVQVGLVNVARHVRGAQLGLVNIADRVDGLSLAPVSIHADNRTRAIAWYDTTLLVNVGVQYSFEPLYTVFSVGGDPAPERDRRAGFGIAIGAHVWQPKPLFVDLDLLYRYVVPETKRQDFQDLHSSLVRSILGWQIAAPVALFATGGLEYRVDDAYRAVPYAGGGVQVF
jgi:hypothetical protein